MHARGAGAYGYFEPYDDGLAEVTDFVGQAAYHLNSLGGGCPALAGENAGSSAPSRREPQDQIPDPGRRVGLDTGKEDNRGP